MAVDVGEGVWVGEGVIVDVGVGDGVAVGVGDAVDVTVGVGSTTTGAGVGVLRIAPQAHPPARHTPTKHTVARPAVPASTRFWTWLSSRGSGTAIKVRRDASAGASGVGSPS